MQGAKTPCTFYFFVSLCRFHSSNSFLPSSVSKKATISGRKNFASDSISCVGIEFFVDAIGHHGLCFSGRPPYPCEIIVE